MCNTRPEPQDGFSWEEFLAYSQQFIEQAEEKDGEEQPN
jgi:hypothetical protein